MAHPEEVAADLLDDAARALVTELAPVIQARVARLLRKRKRGARDPQQEVEDLTQEVFVALFADDARILRSWDPSRGLSLENFVGLVAERRVHSILRSGRRNPWSEEPAEDGVLEHAGGAAPAEGETRLLSREKLDRAFVRLREKLTPRAFDMFFRLVVEGESVVAVSASTGMTPEAVYAWRSRLSKELRDVASELSRSGSWGLIPCRRDVR